MRLATMLLTATLTVAAQAAVLSAGATAADETPAAAVAAGHWLDNYQTALAEAKRTKRPILADFTGSDWCPWCQKLDKEVFGTPAFTAWAADHVVLLDLDFPSQKEQSAELAKQNRDLAEHFAIQGYPTVLILDADGTKRGELGYEEGGPEKWIADAKKAGAN